MAREFRIVTLHAGTSRALAWVSLVDDGAISVGLSDSTFAAPALASDIELNGVVHRQAVDLAVKHRAKAIRNPHFTFHPSARYHLHANGEDTLFCGLLMVDLVVQAEGRLPWIRVVSKVVADLKPFKGGRPGQKVEIVQLPLPSEACSVQLAVDFIRQIPDGGSPSAFHVEWGGRVVELTATHVEPQSATLWWNHES